MFEPEFHPEIEAKQFEDLPHEIGYRPHTEEPFDISATMARLVENTGRPLTANPEGCEEASPLSHAVYIPCNGKATRKVAFPSEGPYRMCEMCADHNVRNRGGHYVEDL